MKRILAIVCLLVPLFCTQSASAAPDICLLATQALEIAPEKFDDFFKNKVARRLLSGRGKLVRIKKVGGTGLRGNIEARIHCSDNIILYVRTNEFGVLAANAKPGDMVSFTGECTKMYESFGKVYCHIRATTR